MIFNMSTGGASTADKVKYNNTESGLNSTDVQGAIDEVNSSLSKIRSGSFNATTDSYGWFLIPQEHIYDCVNYTSQSNGYPTTLLIDRSRMAGYVYCIYGNEFQILQNQTVKISYFGTTN